MTTEIRDVSNLSYNHGSWAVKTSKAMSRILRHDERTVLGKYMECSLEGFQRTSVRPYDWHPRKFFSFLMANSKGRFNIWVAPVALTFGRFPTGTSTSVSAPHRGTAESRVRDCQSSGVASWA